MYQRSWMGYGAGISGSTGRTSVTCCEFRDEISGGGIRLPLTVAFWITSRSSYEQLRLSLLQRPHTGCCLSHLRFPTRQVLQALGGRWSRGRKIEAERRSWMGDAVGVAHARRQGFGFRSGHVAAEESKGMGSCLSRRCAPLAHLFKVRVRVRTG
ncbi:hypothetical protein BDW71DRAFT_189400 [Aspergillus fruticulosus]